MGCTKMSFKIDPNLLDWVQPIPGFNIILKLPRLVDDVACYVCCLYLGVQVSTQFSVF